MRMPPLLLSLACLAAASPTLACRYKPLSTPKKIEKADLIFQGKVREVIPHKESDSGSDLVFDVSRWWKGKNASGKLSKEAVIQTPAMNCGLNSLKAGDEWIIFAHGHPPSVQLPDGSFGVGEKDLQAVPLARQEKDKLIKALGLGQSVEVP